MSLVGCVYFPTHFQSTDVCVCVKVPYHNPFFQGLQTGYFLQRAGRDYVIFERNNTAGKKTIHLLHS